MDDNDTISDQDLSFDEWVVSELSKFNSWATTNLKVGLVDPANYKNGTWFVTRCLAPPISRNDNKMVNLFIRHTVMCDCISNNRSNINVPNIANTLPDLITSGKNTHCGCGGGSQDLHQDGQEGPELEGGQGQHHHRRGGHEQTGGE